MLSVIRIETKRSPFYSRQLSLLLTGMGMIAILAGAIATFVINRAMLNPKGALCCATTLFEASL
jgi:hypothetical protein